MKTLVIYDDTGVIYTQITSGYKVPQGGVNYLEIEITEGKILNKVDTTVVPHVPVYEDVPKTELQSLQEQLAATQALVVSLQEQALTNTTTA